MDKLIEEIKELIISSLDLEDITASDIDENEALFVEGLGLDSIDALELGMAVQKKYGTKIEAQDPDVKTYFASVSNLAKFVSENRKD